MEDLRVFSYVPISVLYATSTTTILMRIYVRGLTMRSFWWDDWVMTGILLSSNVCEIGMSSAASGSNTCAVLQNCPASNLLLFISPWSRLVSQKPNKSLDKLAIFDN